MSNCCHHEWVRGEEVVPPDCFTCSCFLGPFLGLPGLCLLPLPFSLWPGEGTVAKSGAFPYLPEPPPPLSLEDEAGEGSPHLLSECLLGLQASFFPPPPPLPSCGRPLWCSLHKCTQPAGPAVCPPALLPPSSHLSPRRSPALPLPPPLPLPLCGHPL